MRTHALTLLLVAGCAAAPLPPAAPEPDGYTVFVCPNGLAVSVAYVEDYAEVRAGNGDPVLLPRAISGSGARYSDGETEIWEAQGALSLSLPDGTRLEDCRPQ